MHNVLQKWLRLNVHKVQHIQQTKDGDKELHFDVATFILDWTAEDAEF
jgi:hypothetical protein